MNTKAVLNQDFLTAYPFPHSVIPTFLNEEFIELLAKEVLELEFSVKSNDLYTFLQSADLLSVNSRSIVKFREEIYSEDFRNKLKDWTGIDLSPTVDLSAHIYPPSGYLLCHDDDIGKDEDCRRIAFILYLVDEDWSERDGGRLQLFDNVNGEPKFIVKNIIPRRNSFAFFEVLPYSHHQVEPVVSRPRVSISGWFHGRRRHSSLPIQLPSLEILAKWVNPVYLKYIGQIRSKFHEDSHVQLKDFLLEYQYEKIGTAIKGLKWVYSGIPNRALFRVPSFASDSDSLLIVSEFCCFIGSETFRKFINDCVSVTSHISIVEPCRTAAYMRGDYNLMYDGKCSGESIDVYFSVPLGDDEEWDSEWGGLLHYISDENTLLSLFPESNTLDIVKRQDNVQSFVQLVNHKALQTRVDVSISYKPK